MKRNNTLILLLLYFLLFIVLGRSLGIMIVLKHNWYLSTTECGEEILILLWSSE